MSAFVPKASSMGPWFPRWLGLSPDRAKGPHQQLGRKSACLQQLVVASQAFGFLGLQGMAGEGRKRGRQVDGVDGVKT